MDILIYMLVVVIRFNVRFFVFLEMVIKFVFKLKIKKIIGRGINLKL